MAMSINQLKSTVSASTPSVFATNFLFLRLLPADCIPCQSSSSRNNNNNNSSNDTYSSYSQPLKSEPAQHRKPYGSASPVNANFPQRTRSPSHSLSKGTNGYAAEPSSPTNKALNLGSPTSRHRPSTERGTPAPSLPSLLNPEPAAPSPAPAAASAPAPTAPSSVSSTRQTTFASLPSNRTALARTCIRKTTSAALLFHLVPQHRFKLTHHNSRHQAVRPSSCLFPIFCLAPTPSPNQGRPS